MVAPNPTSITNIKIPQSEFLDPLTKRPAREWLFWLQNPNFVSIDVNAGAQFGYIFSDSYIKATTYVQAGTFVLAGSYIQATTHILAGTYLTTGSYITAGTSVTAGTTVNAGTDLNAGNDVNAIADVTAGANVNVGGYIATPTYIDFDNAVANPAYEEGRVFYDDTAKALSYYNDVDGVTINMGQEEVIRVFNNTGATILNGKLCYISGASDEFPEVTLAKADAAATSASTIGMATADIADQEYGYITTSGLVHDVDTSTFTAGQTIYLSDSVAGGYTNVAPLQPSYAIVIGYVTSIDATTGAIYVHIDRLPWYPNGEIRLTAASTALPTTPTVFTAPSVITQQGISYDNATGVLTINVSGSYALSHTFNCSPSAANKKVYFYVEESTDGGTTWVKSRYSARQLELINGTETQLIIVGARYYAMGTKVRYYLWGDATVTLKTTDLPGTTAGTVTLPAYRLTLAG